MPEGLAALQERFYALVTAAEGVGPTLALEGKGADDLAGLVRGDERLGPVERLDIYASMYFFRILDVLRDAYPRVAALVGDAAFHNLATEYLIACRPAHPSIAEVGDRLPAFLAGHPLAEEHPGLVALATIERAYSEVFDGPDAEPLGLAEVRALAPEALAARPLRLIPCHRLLAHDHTVEPLWRALDAGEPAPLAVEAREQVLVWRQDIDVYHRVIDDDERALLDLAARGTTLTELGDALASGSPEDAAQQIFGRLGGWLADGLLRR